jgi:hypothetical protein
MKKRKEKKHEKTAINDIPFLDMHVPLNLSYTVGLFCGHHLPGVHVFA